jgi:hypothetical protein
MCVYTKIAKTVDGGGFGNTAGWTSVFLHHFFAVVTLGVIPIVSRAGQLDVLRAVVTTPAKGPEVVEFEVVTFAATPTLFIYKSTAVTVAFVHRAFDRCRNVARGRRSVGFFQALSGSVRFAEAP